MPDARIPDRWLNDRRIARLDDSDFRSFVMALTWSVSNRTDGHLEVADLPLIQGFAAGAAARLCRAGLWEQASETSWQMLDFELTQTSRAQLDGLDHRRVVDRERKARQRARDSGLSREQSRDVPQDVRRDTKDRPGQDRQGQAPRAEPWSPEELDSCRDCGQELTTAMQRKAGRCNRCQVAAKASTVTPIARAV